MKQQYKFILAFGLAALLFSSCDKYLDVIPKGNDVLTTVEQYALLQNQMSSHNYNPMGCQFIAEDVWVNPLIILQSPNSNNTTFTYQNPETSTPPRMASGFYTKGTGLYTDSYNRINKVCNVTIDNIKDATGNPDLKAQTLAEVHALRAHSYFVLVNVYAKAYNPATANKDLCVPLSTHFDLESFPKQGTVAEVYQLIEEDLAKAIPNLSNTPSSNFHFSKAAGYALKAKVHLFKKEFDKAKEAALESYKLNNYVFNLTTYTGSEYIKADQNPEYLYFAYGSGYTNTLGAISPELATLYTTTCGSTKDNVKDVRYTGFMSYNPAIAGTSATGDKDYVPAYDNTLAITKNYPVNPYGLRTTDVILILAECYAREGDFSNTKKYLDEVRKKRIKGYTTATEELNTVKEAVELVIQERRKELVSGFNRFFDLKRLNTEPQFAKTLVRTAPANPNISGNPQKTYTLSPDSWLYVVPLPEDEFPLYPGLQMNVPY